MEPVVKLEPLICFCPLEDECRCFKCKCDFSQPRNWDDLLPNSEELQARGICPWCGWLED